MWHIIVLKMLEFQKLFLSFFGKAEYLLIENNIFVGLL